MTKRSLMLALLLSGCPSRHEPLDPVSDAGGSDAAATDAPLADSAPADAPSGPTVEDFAEGFVAEMCDTLFDCCDATERASLGADAPDRGSCPDTVGLNADGLAELLGDITAGGRASFDSERAAACLAWLSEATCVERAGAIGRGHHACDLPLTPRVRDGDACTQHPQCLSGYCVPLEERCAPMPRLGEPCSGMCAAGQYCGGESERTCHEEESAGGPCELDAHCAAGLMCRGADPSSGTRGTCVTLDRCLGAP